MFVTKTTQTKKQNSTKDPSPLASFRGQKLNKGTRQKNIQAQIYSSENNLKKNFNNKKAKKYNK